MRITKEVSRGMPQILHFKYIPRNMVKSMALGTNTMFNNIPAINGVLETLRSTTIVVCRHGPDYNVIIRIAFDMHFNLMTTLTVLTTKYRGPLAPLLYILWEANKIFIT